MLLKKLKLSAGPEYFPPKLGCGHLTLRIYTCEMKGDVNGKVNDKVMVSNPARPMLHTWVIGNHKYYFDFIQNPNQSRVCLLLGYVANRLPGKYIGHCKQFYFVQRMCMGCMCITADGLPGKHDGPENVIIFQTLARLLHFFCRDFLNFRTSGKLSIIVPILVRAKCLHWFGRCSRTKCPLLLVVKQLYKLLMSIWWVSVCLSVCPSRL